MPKLNVQQNNANVIKAFQVALDIGHRNLLDNPFFTVRQRGNGPFTGNVYGVDRWRGGNSRSTITGNSGYITLATNTSGNGILRQILPQTYEGTYTFSTIVGGNGSGALFFHDSGGTIIGDAVEFTTTGSDQLVTATITTSGTALGGVAVRVDVGNTISVVCAKLEKGSVSTLANDTPPNYAEELAKCQYIAEMLSSTGMTVGVGFAVDTTQMRFPIKLSPKRATPSVSLTGTANVGQESANIAVNSIALNAFDPNTGIGEMRVNTPSSLTIGSVYKVVLQSGAKILFSADL